MAKKKEQPKAKAKPRKKAVHAKKRAPRKKSFTFTFEDEQYSLTPLQKSFCERFIDPYLTFYNVVDLAGYNVRKQVINKDGKKESVVDVNLANGIAWENLQKTNIKKYIRYLLDAGGLSEELADRQHLKLVTSDNEASVVRGLDMFYKLTGKYSADKVEHNVNKDLKDAISLIRDALP